MSTSTPLFRASRALLWVIPLIGLSLFGCDAEDAALLTQPEAALEPMSAHAPSAQALKVKPTFNTSLSGRAAGTDSQGTGEAWFRFHENRMEVEFRLVVANIENVTMAHIHVAATPGGNGPPVVWLYPEGPPPVQIPGRTQGPLAKGSFSAADLVGPLAGETIMDLRSAIAEGRAYVNVHTAQFPGGEIRGTIR